MHKNYIPCIAVTFLWSLADFGILPMFSIAPGFIEYMMNSLSEHLFTA